MDLDRLVVRKVTKEEYSRILSVYTAARYDGGIIDTDIGFLATWENQPVGAVRLCMEHNMLVLRGMMVHPEFQRQGVGKALLNILDLHIGGTPCYCINPHHLELFYGSIGFKQTDPEIAPVFLAQRLDQYNREKHKCMLMFRHISGYLTIP